MIQGAGNAHPLFGRQATIGPKVPEHYGHQCNEADPVGVARMLRRHKTVKSVFFVAHNCSLLVDLTMPLDEETLALVHTASVPCQASSSSTHHPLSYLAECCELMKHKPW